MRNITVCISDEIYRQARLYAARRDQSVSDLVRRFFNSLPELPSNPYGHDRPDAETAEDPLPPLFR